MNECLFKTNEFINFECQENMIFIIHFLVNEWLKKAVICARIRSFLEDENINVSFLYFIVSSVVKSTQERY